MMRIVMITALLAGLALAEGTGPNRLPENVPQKGAITLKSGDYTVLLAPERAYTILEIHYRGVELGNSNGAYGTVILTVDGKEHSRDPKRQGDPWFGTGHGGEVVHAVTCTVDGEPRGLDEDGVITGERIVFTKDSTIYKFRGLATLELTAEGLVERQQLRALEPLDDLWYLYFFMHAWSPRTSRYIAVFPDGHEVAAPFPESSASVQLYRQCRLAEDAAPVNCHPRWQAQYLPEAKLSILQMLAGDVPGSGLIQVRPNYHKSYVVLPVRGRQFAKDEVIDHSLRIRVIDEAPDRWENTRQAATATATKDEQ